MNGHHQLIQISTVNQEIMIRLTFFYPIKNDSVIFGFRLTEWEESQNFLMNPRIVLIKSPQHSTEQRIKHLRDNGNVGRRDRSLR